MDFGYPWRIGADGRTATDGAGAGAGVGGDEAHIRAMIEQLLLTAAGERVNRPDFGGGLDQLVFAPNGPELAAALQLTLQAAVGRYLADVIDVVGLAVAPRDEALVVEVGYRVRATATTGVAAVVVPVADA